MFDESFFFDSEDRLMECAVCGDENGAEFHAASGQVLCKSCREGTPAKVSREEFDKAYWVSDDPDEALPAENILREFYEDYQRSTHTLEQYIKNTVSYA